MGLQLNLILASQLQVNSRKYPVATTEETRLPTDQRISLLESALTKSQLLLKGVLAVLALLTAAVITLMIIQLNNPPSSFAETATFQQVKIALEQLESSSESWQQQLDELNLELDNSQAAVFKALMFEQEENTQLHLRLFKQSMRDLAQKQSGSQAWLAGFNQKIEAALARSEARKNKLAQIQTSEQPSIKAVPLPFQPDPVNVSD